MSYCYFGCLLLYTTIKEIDGGGKMFLLTGCPVWGSGVSHSSTSYFLVQNTEILLFLTRLKSQSMPRDPPTFLSALLESKDVTLYLSSTRLCLSFSGLHTYEASISISFLQLSLSSQPGSTARPLQPVL